MKKEERGIFIELASQIDASLCTFCRYGDWYSEGCCEGHNECQHPITELSWENKNEDGLYPGGDCYGFKPSFSVQMVADIVGSVLSQGYRDWGFLIYSKKRVTVYGNSPNNQEGGKVRINQ